MTATQEKYPYLTKVSKQAGIPAEKLLEVYEMEHDFYKKIMHEPDFDKRQKLYEYVYTETDKIFSTDHTEYFLQRVPIKTRIAKLFRKELEGKALLDVGCGDGTFLYALAKTGISTKELYGLDIKTPSFPNDAFGEKIKCYSRNIIKFEVPQQFDTLMLDNVYEHIAPQDNPFFLDSLCKSLKPGGKLIMMIPHSGFGPTDFAKIVEYSNTGKIQSHCVHLNETTYTQVIKDLTPLGFHDFQTNVPFLVFSKLRHCFPNLRLPATWFARLENNRFWMPLMKKILYKSRCLFRMEVLIIATYK